MIYAETLRFLMLTRHFILLFKRPIDYYVVNARIVIIVYLCIFIVFKRYNVNLFK